MANFKCDICGGDIKMQANKTGVCQSCGMEYDIDAIRAMVGQKAESEAPVQSDSSVPVAPASNDEIDRETLITYLDNLRVIETVIHQNNLVIKKLDDKVSEEKKKYNEIKRETEHPILREPRKPVKPTLKEALSQACGPLIAFGGFGILFCIVLPSLAFIGIFLCIFGIIMTVTMYYGVLKDYEDKYKEYSVKESDFKSNELKNQRILETRKNSFEAVNKKVNKEKPPVYNEIASFKKILKKAYSANIIPQQFRNIEGVYYLYDYLSTSNQSLSEALMQANLEAIKQKMDNMIKLQSVQIVQQAQTNAKLGKLINVSEATMNNTAVAAKYAQISAVNSELNVKLSAESLAYQKAAFWLK